jgi:hypothetical protein
MEYMEEFLNKQNWRDAGTETLRKIESIWKEKRSSLE